MPNEIPLLATKLFLPPARTTLVSRPGLVARFAEGLTHPLTLVSAPAGSGKTTLLANWRASDRGRVHALAWLSLDSDDNDPVRFLTYLIAALARARPTLGAATGALLHSAQPPAPRAVLAYLIDEFSALPEPLALVLDDYHVITAGPVHEAVAFLLDHLPPQLHLVILTRADPPLPLARLRARDQLAEMRGSDLRFTLDEAGQFLAQVTGLSLSPDDVAALAARTEGWIAGLQLAALSMKGRSDLAGFVKAFTGSHVYVAEYLLEEVLRREPPPIQDFLLQTSILERLSVGLCQAVAGRPDAQAVLADLDRANLFVIPLDDEGHWFRYHHLFADLLQARLLQSQPEDAIFALHRRAAAWYEQNGLAREAVHHALAARDFDGAGRLVELNVNPLMSSGQLATLLEWIKTLPGDVVGRRPLLATGAAWVFTFAGAIEPVDPLLRQAEAQVAGAPDTAIGREVRGNAAVVRALLALMAGDEQRALGLAQSANGLLPESSFQARSLLPYTLGSALRAQGQVELAARAFAQVAALGEATGDLLIWATGVTEMVNTRHAQGRLRVAREVGRQGLERLAERGAARLGSAAKLEVALCDVLREQGELVEARWRLAEAIERMQGWDMPTDQLFGYLNLAHTCRSQGDLAAAFAALGHAKALQAAHPILEFLARAVDRLEIRLSLASGDIAAAARLADALALAEPARRGASRSVPVREQELMTLARVRLAQGQVDEAAGLLRSLAAGAETSGRGGAYLEIRALQACALAQQGDRDSAITVLIQTLAAAEPEGFVRVFADEGENMQALLRSAARRLETSPGRDSSRLRAYVARLLQACSEVQPAGAASAERPAAGASLIEPLTARELEVLRLIATGDSNRAIAAKLVITVSAVKKHAGNLFGKLGVRSRTQAIARARELGLLPTDS